MPTRQAQIVGFPTGEAREPKPPKPKQRKQEKPDPEWAEAKKLCRLNADSIRKAKALGMSPRSLLKNRPSPSQKWKAPVHVWIDSLYEERFPGEA